jgi:hypothetical protein
MSLHFRRAFVLLSGITLALSACATGPELDVTIHESERGAVYVERFADRSFQASHPIRVSADMMTRVLRGVVVKDTGGVLGSLVVSKPQTMQAFGNEDVEYLAPLLADGLARAASDQQVGFRVVQVSEPVSPQSGGLTFCASSVRFPGACSSEQPLLTGGSLYVSGRSLYVTLTEFRHRLEPGEIHSKTAPGKSNSNGLANRTVYFVPESAARSTDATLVIDYDLLATMPAASYMQPTSAQPPTPVKGEPTPRNADVDELRKELHDIKKKLAEQEAERSRSKP